MLKKPQFLSILVAFWLATHFSIPPVVILADNHPDDDPDQIFLGDAVEDLTPYLENGEVKDLTDSDLEEIKQRIKQLEQKLVRNRVQLVESEEKSSVNYEKLAEIRDRKQTLAAQLQIINDEIVFTQRQINTVEAYLNTRRQEIRQIDQDIISGTNQLEKQKDTLVVILRELYDQNRYPPLLALVGSASLADLVNQRSYLAKVETVGEQSYQGIKQLRNNMVAQRISVDKLKRSLAELTDSLQERREGLALQEEAKIHFLGETQEEEDLYRQLLEDSRRKQIKIDEEIAGLRLDLRELLNQGSDIVANDPEILAFLQKPSGKGMLWPVTPLRGISAYFLDQSYKRAFGIPHHAIDIRSPQQTPVWAVDNAYVLKAQDNGFGYSYIVLAHGNGVTTVYGHVAEIFVKQGQVVRQGEVIGLTGGMPGSRGAGWLTTGPHLHFEIRLNGQPQNPVAYLPPVELALSIKEKRLSELNNKL